MHTSFQLPQQAKFPIRPYPIRYIQPWTSRGALNIRPIRPEDEPLMIGFHEGLSEESVYLRYFHALNLDQGLGTEFLRQLVQIGRDEGDIGRITAYMLAENIGMRRVAEKMEFAMKFEEQLIRASLEL